MKYEKHYSNYIKHYGVPTIIKNITKSQFTSFFSPIK